MLFYMILGLKLTKKIKRPDIIGTPSQGISAVRPKTEVRDREFKKWVSTFSGDQAKMENQNKDFQYSGISR